MVTFRSVQCHPGLTYIFNFWHSGALALTAERQSAHMSEIKNVSWTWMAKCNQLTSLPFRGLTNRKAGRELVISLRRSVTSHGW